MWGQFLAQGLDCGIVEATGSKEGVAKRRMTASFRLGHVFGIPLTIHYTWLIAAGLATVSLSVVIFPFERPGLTAPAYWLVGAVGSGLFFSSVVAHELSHALVARHFGIPVRGITLFIFGGVSTMAREARKPAHELLIAIAGPACSLLLCVALFILQRLLLPHWLLGSRVILYLSIANLFLTLFNLIPALPLDGGRALRAALWHFTGNFRLATKVAASLGHLLAFALIGFAIYRLAVHTDWVQGGLLIVLGLFVHNAAEMAQQDAQERDLLSGLTMEDVPKSNVAYVAPETPLQTLVYEYLLAEDSPPSVLAVMRDRTLLGVATAREIRRVASVHWSHTQAQDIMKEYSPEEFLTPATLLEDALEHMDVERLGHVIVANGEEGGLEVVSYNDMIRFLHRRQQALR